ncbi:MAG: lamin tail domain-containing protein [Balneolia bacterium]|nr:lamin tail domain-containing protein [Balneolia bacterium]
MFYRVLLFLFAFSLSFNVSLSAQQVIVEDDFSDGDFTQNPEWIGTTENWIIEEFQGTNVLRLNASEAGESHLSTESIANYGEWEFSVYHNGFNPSNVNRAHVFMIADRANTSDGVNGYAVRVGQNMPGRTFRVVRFNDGSVTETIINGETIIEQDTWYRVRVTRTEEGEWSLFISEGLEGEFQQEGSSAVDNTMANAAWFSIRPSYTVGNINNFIFDNIRVTKNPLSLAGVNVIDSQTLEAVFSEAIDPATAVTENFTLSFEGSSFNPDQTSLTDDNTVRLQFDDELEGGNYILSIQNIQDLAGGTIEPVDFPFEILDMPAPGDIIINEFFYDEPGNFPQYVELFNNSDKLLNLNSWRIQDNTTTTRWLTTEDFTLGPGEYVVLTGNAAGLAERFGDRPYLELGNFPSLNRASADQIKIFTDVEVLMDSLRYEPSTWGGDDAALERRSAEAVSYARENWSESTDPLSGTPGLPNTAEPDPDPIIFTSISYSDSQTLIARFDRHIDRATGEDEANYSLDPDITVTSALKTDSREVVLSLGDEMISNTAYTVSAWDVESIFGVPMDEQSLGFTYFEIEAADSGDVFINEFMYDVAPDFSRYIELYNASDKALDLQGWTSNNDTGNRRTVTSESTIFPPNSYIILAPDDQLLDIFPDLNLINMGSRFSALKTSGDDIVIRDADGMLIDSLRYRPSWGGSQVALERRSIEAAAFYQENWGDSPSPQLGTPGEPNLIEPDLTAPEFVSATASMPQMLTLIFSKSMDPEAAQNPGNYTISPSVSIDNITADGNVVTVETSSPFESGTDYTITMQNLTDIFGNALGDVTAGFSFLEFETPESGDVIVNEFVYRPVTGETPRFIELYNRSERNINLQDWRIGRSNAVIQLSGQGGIIPLAAGEYIVITDQPGQLGLGPGQSAPVSSMLALSQNGDSIYLQDSNGMLVDSLWYSPSWGGSPGGFSLERLDPEAASNDPTNWATHPEGNSAGEENANFLPNETEPRVIFAKRTEDGRIEVRFSEFVAPVAQSGFTLNGSPLQIDEFNPFAGDRVFLTETGSSGTNTSQTDAFGDEDEVIEINRLNDVPGNEAANLSIPIAQPLLPGDLAINEIMFQPFSDSSNEFPDQSEYVEFFNRRDYAINMEGFFIHEAPDRDGNIAAINPVTTESGWIPARGYAVMYADPQPAFSSSRIAQFFELDEPSTLRFFRADRSTLSLNVSEDSVFLAGSDGTTIDSVFYSSTWHNPNLVDTRGIAVERIDPFGPGNTGENWGSSVVSRGGTPGGQNSLFQTPDMRPESEGIVLEPNPFSPDGDGRDDNLFINYTFDQPDYLLRVRIFDRYGRLVRTLADGRAAGLEGTLTWDGRRDNGMENRIGIYIVLVEAYNSSSGSNRTFRETVVLARQL